MYALDPTLTTETEKATNQLPHRLLGNAGEKMAFSVAINMNTQLSVSP
jgi:hypothetical protein